MRFQAVIENVTKEFLSDLGVAVEKDAILEAVDEDAFEEMVSQCGRGIAPGTYALVAKDALAEMVVDGNLFIDLSTDERDVDDQERYPGELMAAISTAGGQFIYLNEGQNETGGVRPPYVEILQNGRGRRKIEVLQFGNVWRPVLRLDASKAEREVAEDVDAVLQCDDWLLEVAAFSPTP